MVEKSTEQQVLYGRREEVRICMKILLIAVNAKYIHSNPAVYSLKAYADSTYSIEDADTKESAGGISTPGALRAAGRTFGLGLPGTAGSTANSGIPETAGSSAGSGVSGKPDIEIAEYTVNQRTEELLADLYRRKPDLAAFSCYIWNWRIIEELLTEIPKILPELPIWLGGPEVSFDPEHILQAYPMVKGIMAGEGEETFRELVSYYTEGTETRQLSSIQGILYREEGRIYRTGERGLLPMDSLPFLYARPESFQNRIVYYESSRGCPFRCSYCLSSIDKTVRFRSLDLVKQELEVFLTHQVAQVKFVDRTFNCSRTHAMAVWQYILEHDNGITNFHFEIAAELLGEEELALLARMRPGLIQFEIGVQTTNPRVLEEICRSTELDRLEAAVARLREKRNIHIHLDLIAGLPYEDKKSFQDSFCRVYGMRPDQLQLGFLKVLKGSPMEAAANAYGIRYTDRPPYEILCSQWISYGELCRLKQIEEMTELYYNSGQFSHTIAVLERAFEHPFAMFEALADYYEEQGLLIRQPSRSYRYQILLDFAVSRDEEHRELYRELLTYDLYLRENMKSRPGFAPDQEPFREKIRECYRRQEIKELSDRYPGISSLQVARLTHAEVFHYPLWEEDPAKMSRRLEDSVLAVFDYREKDPVTCEASVYWKVLEAQS